MEIKDLAARYLNRHEPDLVALTEVVLGGDPNDQGDLERARALVEKLYAEGLIAVKPEEFKLPAITVFTDGLCEPNPGGVATHAWLARQGSYLLGEGRYVTTIGEEATNNVAEYHGVIAALEWLIKEGLNNREIILYTDSQLVIGQVKTCWNINADNLKPLHKKVLDLLAEFKHEIPFIHVRSKENPADALTVQAFCEFHEFLRMERAREVDEIEAEPGGYLVKGKYHVKLGDRPSCTCPDFLQQSKRFPVKCKHLLAVIQQYQCQRR